jgi:hypothetical protein
MGYLSSFSLSSIISTPQLTSSLVGLGSMGYISSASLLSSFSSIARNFQTLNLSVSSLGASNIFSLQAVISSLTVSTLIFGDGDGFLDFPDLRTQSLSTLSIYTSTINGEPVFSRSILQSTIIGLGTLGYLSSAVTNLSSIISTPQLTSSLQGLGSIGYISSTQLTSTAQGLTTYINTFIDPLELASSITGLGTVQFISSIGLLSTSQGLANYITSFIDPLELASTVTGLGSAQYVSTTVTATNANLTSSLLGLGTLGYLSSAITNLSSIISTPQLTSSLIGLGSMGYISSAQLTSTAQGLTTYINSFIDPEELASSIT